MRMPILIAVAGWLLVCAGMLVLSYAPAHSKVGSRGDAYIPDIAHALPETGTAALPQPQRVVPANLKPWQNDPMYQQELNLLIRQSALRQRQLQERAEADKARLNAQRMQNTNSHLSALERLGDRDNRRYTDYGDIASRQAAREADYRARASQIAMTLETGQLREQQDLLRKISSLDNQYARQEPYRTMLQGR